MKLVFITLIFFCIRSYSQSTYDATISFPMSDTTDEAGAIYKRKGFIETVNYYPNIQNIGIIVKIKLFNNIIELKRVVQPYSRFFTISNNIFVISATGVVIGNRDAMRAQFGIIQRVATDSTPAIWRQSVLGGDSLTTPCIGQYDYLSKQFDNSNKFTVIVKGLAIAAAGEGKLN